MSCRFTTCLDSRKTGHCVRKNVLAQDAKDYGWGLPDCMQHVETDEWSQSQRGNVKRDKSLTPFILDSLRSFGEHLAGAFLGEYEKLSSQPGVSKFTAPDRHLFEPHQRIVRKLTEIESFPEANNSEIIQEARRELRMIESHVDKMKAQWSSSLTPKKKSGSTQNGKIEALRIKFASGPDVPHLSLLGDIPAIRASYAYRQCRAENPNFAFAMAFEELCKIKAQELGGTILTCGLAELMTIPKTAVRTLSAIRALT
jgi:RNA-dependent RNA polymerase